MPYRATGPAALHQLLRILALALLVSAFLLAVGCGGSSSSTTTTTTGPSPKFTSTAPQIAQEGILYTYTLTSTTSDNSTVTYTVATGPTGATISGDTLLWTPTHAQSRTANAFTIKATTSANGTASQTFSITPNGNVDGTAVDHAVTGTGLQNYPEDLSGSVVEALVSNGKGGFNTLKGSGDSSGNFSVPNVPVGSFWLHIQQPYMGMLHENYIWTNASDVDAGSLLPGRPDAVAATLGVTINTNNIGLTVSPTPTDSLFWGSSDALAYGVGYPSTLSNPLVSTFGQSGNLIDSSKGDRAFLVHYVNNGTGANSIVEAKEYDSITQTNGGTTNLSGAMTASGGSTVDPVIDTVKFDAIFSGLTNTSGITRALTLEDAGYPGTEGSVSGIPLVTGNIATPASDSTVGSVAYGLVTSNGVPYFLFTDSGTQSLTAAGNTVDFSVGSQMMSNVVPASSSTIVPLLSAPRSASVDGKSFLVDLTNVSLTPQVAWNPPSIGVPTSYELTVIDMSNPLGNPTNFFTNGNSVSIPSGVLQPGGTYAFYLRSQLAGSTTYTTAPFRTGTTNNVVSMASGVMSTVSAASPSTGKTNAVTNGHYRISPRLDGSISVTAVR